MKKLPHSLAVLCLCTALMSGCGGDGSDPVNLPLAFQNCVTASTQRMFQVLYGILQVPDAIMGEVPLPGFFIDGAPSSDPLDPPNTWNFAVEVDTDADASSDTVIVGQVTFSEDPTDGLDPGATLQFDFTIQNTPLLAGLDFENGTLTGSGSLLATQGALPDEATISGTLNMTDTAGDGCVANLTFPVGTPLNLSFSGAAPVQLAADVGLFEAFGTIQALLETLGHDLDALVTLTENSEVVDALGTIDGSTDFDFSFDLLPTNPEMGQMFGCAVFSVNIVQSLGEIFGGIINSGVLNGDPPPPGVIITSTANPNVFNYTVDLAVTSFGGFDAGTLSGQATLDFPVLMGTLPSTVSCTWTLVGASTSPTGPLLSGTSTRPMRVRLDGVGTPVSFSGAGTLDITQPVVTGIVPVTDCSVAFDILETHPLTFDGLDGIMLLTVIQGNHVMALALDFFEEVANSMFNWIPYPFFF